MKRRMGIAVLALGGVFLSLYLLLYKLGVYGEIVCGTGGCETVQTSEYASFLGVPVAGWGVAWYVAVFVVAVLSIQASFSEQPWPGRALLWLAVAGVLFSAYLTYLELFVIDAICRWCVASAVLTVLILALAIPLPSRERARVAPT